MIVVGAGMAGLLAGHMLRRHSPVVYEAQSSLPNNHAALLRFRTNKVSEATGIPFRRVWVRKAVFNGQTLTDRPTLAENNEYSIKVTGEARDRSLFNLEPGERFIAPPDFIGQLARGLHIEYNNPFDFSTCDSSEREPVVSTIPMPVLMKMVEWPNIPEFKSRPIWTATWEIEQPVTDLYQTIYYPSLGTHYYRASLTGRKLTIEYMIEPDDKLATLDMEKVLKHFGFGSRFLVARGIYQGIKGQVYGKLLPIPDEVRKEFILAMTDRYNIYSVGRFATWRQILLDDVVKDLQFVDRLVTARDSYTRRLHSVNT